MEVPQTVAEQLKALEARLDEMSKAAEQRIVEARAVLALVARVLGMLLREYRGSISALTYQKYPAAGIDAVEEFLTAACLSKTFRNDGVTELTWATPL